MPEEKIVNSIRRQSSSREGLKASNSREGILYNTSQQTIQLPKSKLKANQSLSVTTYKGSIDGRDPLVIIRNEEKSIIAEFYTKPDEEQIYLNIYNYEIAKVLQDKGFPSTEIPITDLEIDKKLDIRVKGLGDDIGLLFSAFGYQLKGKDNLNIVHENEEYPFDFDVSEKFIDLAIKNNFKEDSNKHGCLLGENMKLDSPTMQSLLRMTAMNQPIFYDAIAQKTLGDKTDKSKQVVLTSTSYQFYDKNGNLQRRPMEFMEVGGKPYVYLSIVEGDPRQRREHAGRFYELSEINLTDDNRIFFTIKDRSLVTVDRAHINSRILEIPYAKDENGSSKFVGFVSDIAKNYKIRNASENTPQANATLSNKEYGVRDDWKHSNQTIHNYDSAGFVRHDDAESVLRKDKAKETEPNIEPEPQPENTEEQAGSEAAEPETTSLVVSRENEDDNQDADEIVYGTISTGDPDVEFLQNYAGDTTNSVPPNSQTIDQPEETAEGPTFGYTFKNYNPLYTNDTTIVTESSTSDLSSLVENDHADAIENGRGGVLPERTETRDDVDPQPVPEPQPEPQQEPQPEPEPEPQSQSPADGGGNPTAPQEEEEIETQKKKSALDIPFIDKKGFDKDKSNELAAKVGTGILGVGVVLMAFSVIIPFLAPFVIVAFATSTIVFTKPWEWVQVSKSNAIDRANAKLAKEKLKELKRERIEENERLIIDKNQQHIAALQNENAGMDARINMLEERKSELQKQNGILYMSADSGEDTLPDIKLKNPKTLDELETMSKADRRAYETHFATLLSLGITDETNMTEEQEKQLKFLEGSMKRDYSLSSDSRIAAHREDLVTIMAALQEKNIALDSAQKQFDKKSLDYANELKIASELANDPNVVNYIKYKDEREKVTNELKTIKLDSSLAPEVYKTLLDRKMKLEEQVADYKKKIDNLFADEKTGKQITDYLTSTDKLVDLDKEKNTSEEALKTLKAEINDLALKGEIAKTIFINDKMAEAHKNDKPILIEEQRKSAIRTNSGIIQSIDNQISELKKIQTQNNKLADKISEKSKKDFEEQAAQHKEKGDEAYTASRVLTENVDEYLRTSTASAAVQAEQDYIKAQQEEAKEFADKVLKEYDRIAEQRLQGKELKEALDNAFLNISNVKRMSSPELGTGFDNLTEQAKERFGYTPEEESNAKQVVDKNAVRA